MTLLLPPSRTIRANSEIFREESRRPHDNMRALHFRRLSFALQFRREIGLIVEYQAPRFGIVGWPTPELLRAPR